MRGSTPENGITALCFQHLFRAISIQEAEMPYRIHFSAYQLYHESLSDLLLSDRRRNPNDLQIRDSPENGIYVKNLSSLTVASYEEIFQACHTAWRNQAIEQTSMSINSARIYTIFTVSLERVDRNDPLLISKPVTLQLVEMAGSEKEMKLNSKHNELQDNKTPTRLYLSMNTLDTVVAALNNPKAKFVPYRNSKITRLLQASLEGKIKTLWCLTRSPTNRDYDNTLSTLRFANQLVRLNNRFLHGKETGSIVL